MIIPDPILCFQRKSICKSSLKDLKDLKNKEY